MFITKACVRMATVFAQSGSVVSTIAKADKGQITLKGTFVDFKYGTMTMKVTRT
ncbi:hypothetical protein HZA42_02105 [Candidatus Peregrinibacteria bacterium]|nr:hypothetical protein [Candidatus Peregrinibacteria bacterium]